MNASLLQEQLGTYRKYASEPWRADHELAMLSYDMEDAVALGLTLLERMQNRLAVAHGSGVGPPALIGSPDREQWQRLFGHWRDESARILAICERLKLAGYLVKDYERLQAHFDEVRLLGMDVDRLAASLAAISRDDVLPLSEAAREFRRRRYSAGV